MTEVTIGRANIYGLLSRAFAYPDEETIEVLRNGAEVVVNQLDTLGLDGCLRQAALVFAEVARATSVDELHRHYNELFVGRRHCQFDESEFDKAIFNRYQRLADVAGFYRAFGFDVSNESFQRADFIGTELEFMQVLLLKRAYAEEQGWNTETQTCVAAENIFIKEHLEWWVTSMCEGLREDKTCAFYTSLSKFLDHFVRTEALRCLQPT